MLKGAYLAESPRARRWVVLLVTVLVIVLLATAAMVEFAVINFKAQQAEAAATSAGNNLKDTMEPLAVTDGKIEFIPSVTTPSTWVDVKGWLKYSAIIGISYEYYDELVDGRLSKPLISSTNISGISFQYESYNSYLGGPAWRARKGFTVLGTETRYMDANTKANSSGTYKAKLGGGPGYLPNPYPCSAWLNVR